MTLEQRLEISTHIVDALGALPLKDMFLINANGELEISGKVVDIEKALQLREHANSALDNKMLITIREQVGYEAFVNGIHKGVSQEQLYFYRAALWWESEVEKHLKKLAGRE